MKTQFTHLKFPCTNCVTLAICFVEDNKKKVLTCELIQKFIEDNIFESATNMVKSDHEKLGFYYYEVEHPIHDHLGLLLHLLVHSNRVGFNNYRIVRKI